MTLARMFAAAVARQPETIAIVDGEVRRSYGDWQAEILALAGGLRARGLGPGDRLVAVLANRREMATLYWACQYLGLIFTPFNWRASTPEMAYVLTDAEAKAVVYEERSAAAMVPAAAEAGLAAEMVIDVDASGEASLAGITAAAQPFDGEPPRDDGATSLMLYTSGTTGRPKGVPRSHAAEQYAALACLAQLHCRHGEIFLGVMPLFHTMGVRALLMSAFLNGRFICQPTFDAETVAAVIAREGVSTLFLVPTMFHDLVHHPRATDFDFSSVWNIAYAGMSMTTALIEACTEKFDPELFSNYYGSSEIYSLSVCTDMVGRPGSAGRACMGQTLRIVTADSERLVGPDELVETGESGEIIADMASPDAFDGYWKRPDADQKSIRDGWYFTGDLGRFDDAGELQLLGRVDDMIISGGENIYAEEVEDVLAKSEQVHGVAVIGLPDDRWGERVTAFIEPAQQNATAAALDTYCLDSGLARFKRPKGYVFVRQIPRSASGKLLRRHLRTGEYEQLSDFDNTL
ncbi:MAG: AMP-binding protein [Alphaproteobacteria bacterium]|jgi:2-furoate---CoA ligase|nr:AMP-binding protein [Alphaproteobacteria bacterium]